MSSRSAAIRSGVSIALIARMRRRWLLSMATLGADGISVRSDARECGRQHGVSGQGDGQVRSRQSDRYRHSGAPGGGKFERTLIKDPRGPDPLPVIVSRLPKAPPVPAVAINQQGVGAPAPRYIQPGPWKSTLTEKDVIGVWLGFGVGAPKQYFIIRKVGNKLRGMVCGTCDNPYTMAALDDFEIQGDTLKFNILHEDWGDGELPTFYKHVTAHVGWNELRCTTAADHQPPPPPRPRPPGFVPGFSLTGPIAIEATAGNRWPEWPPQNTSLPH